MEVIFIQYPKCGTCQKAAKWLKSKNIKVEIRDIVIENPKAAELKLWINKSGLSVSKFFNTSGLRYKELKLKDRVKTASTEELIDLLATEGKLVKRPILIVGDIIRVGFNEDQWLEAINSLQS